MASAYLPASVIDALPPWATTWQAAAASAAAASAIVLYGVRRWAAGGQNPHHPDLTGKIALVTGANTGIGLETSKELAKLGATVIVAGRNASKVAKAVDEVNDAAGLGPGAAKSLIVDLSDRASVEKAAKRVSDAETHLDLLVNNAAIMFAFGHDRSEGPDGFEEQFQTNVIGHALLTDGLLELMEKSDGNPRIINVSSLGHEYAPATMYEDLQSKAWISGASAYGISKLGNMLHAKALNNRLESRGTRVRAFSAHPGAVRTSLTRNLGGVLQWITDSLIFMLGKSPVEGAQTSLYLCTAPLDELTPGGYYADCAEAPVTSIKGLYTSKNAEAFLVAVEEMMHKGTPMDRVKGASLHG